MKNPFPLRIIDNHDHMTAAKFYLESADQFYDQEDHRRTASATNLAIAHALTGILQVLNDGDVHVRGQME